MIRIASLKDYQTILQFNIQLAKETENLTLDYETVKQGVLALLSDSTKGHYYIYEENNEILGQLLITFEWSDWRNGQFWWIQSVYVNQKARQRGIFHKLYTHVKAIAESNNSVCGIRLYVEVHNEIAKKTYENLGMYQAHYHLYEWIK